MPAQARTPTLAPGSVLRGAAGSWKVIKSIGAGSFATTALARCSTDGTLAAVKTSEASDRVDQEIEALLRLSAAGGHPNVVKLLDVIREEHTGGNVHICLEYVDGMELFEFLQSQKDSALKEDLVRVIIDQLLDGLSFIHARGALHRDIKLDNIMVSSSGLVKIIDFNLSASLNSDSTFTDPCGSIRYAAPTILELATSGLPYPGDGGWPDVFSASVCAYSLLTGYWPFRGETADEALEDYLSAFDARGNFGMDLVFPDSVSAEAREFIRSGMDSRYRFRACEMKAHRWLRSADARLAAEDTEEEDEEEEIPLTPIVGSPVSTLCSQPDMTITEAPCWSDVVFHESSDSLKGPIALGSEPSAPPLEMVLDDFLSREESLVMDSGESTDYELEELVAF